MEMLDRDSEPVKWKIAHEFAQWSTRAATQSQGSNERFPSKQADINRYLDTVDFGPLFDRTLGPIEEDEFTEWHHEQVDRLQERHMNISVGWAAKMVAIYLKITCYLSGFGREGLASIIHPPFDNILMEQIAEHSFSTFPHDIKDRIDDSDYQMALRNAEEVRADLLNARIEDIDDSLYWEVLIVNCELAADNLGCTPMEVEQLWTTQ